MKCVHGRGARSPRRRRRRVRRGARRRSPARCAVRVTGNPRGPVVDATRAIRDGSGPTRSRGGCTPISSTVVGGLRALLLPDAAPARDGRRRRALRLPARPVGPAAPHEREFVAATTYGTSREAMRSGRPCPARARAGTRDRDGRAAVLGGRPDPPRVRARHRGRQLPRRVPALRARRRSPMPTPTGTSSEMAVVADAFGADPVPTTPPSLRELLAPYRAPRDERGPDGRALPHAAADAVSVRPIVRADRHRGRSSCCRSRPSSSSRLVVPPLAGPFGVRPAARAFVLGTLRWALGESPTLAATARDRVTGDARSVRRRSGAEALAERALDTSGAGTTARQGQRANDVDGALRVPARRTRCRRRARAPSPSGRGAARDDLLDQAGGR